MTNNSEPNWYLRKGKAQYWDGNSWRRFIWNESPGTYEFPNGIGKWNGQTFESYEYVDIDDQSRNKLNKYSVDEVVVSEIPKAPQRTLNTYQSLGFIEKVKLFISYFLGIVILILGLYAVGSIINEIFFAGGSVESEVTMCDSECQNQIKQEEYAADWEAEIDSIKADVWCDEYGNCT